VALRWRNVDLIGSELQVLETAFKMDNGTYVIKEPKTPHSRRAVSLPPSLALLLQQHRVDQQALLARCGKQLGDDDFVFCHPDGTPLNPNAVTSAFIKLIRGTGLLHLRLHDLRHTHATLMLKAGVHPKVVSERLGHASIGITLDTYSHVLPGLQQAAAERFDALLEERMPETKPGANVSKMLAKEDDLAGEPCGIRTHGTLIKSNVVKSPIFRLFSKLESAQDLFDFSTIRLTSPAKSG
jgi:integrase